MSKLLLIQDKLQKQNRLNLRKRIEALTILEQGRKVVHYKSIFRFINSVNKMLSVNYS